MGKITTILPIFMDSSSLLDNAFIAVSRSMELNLLGRYYQAVKSFYAKHILRITSGCPLFNPDVCMRMTRPSFGGVLVMALDAEGGK